MDTLRFCDRLKGLLKERHLTYEDLADATKIHVSTIKKYGSDAYKPKKRTKNIETIASYLGVYPEWLLTGKGYKCGLDELQESAKTSTVHKWVVDAQLKAQRELREHILKYYKIYNPFDIANHENMTHKQWEQAEKESIARNDMINSIFNYMDMAVDTYRRRIEEIGIWKE